MTSPLALIHFVESHGGTFEIEGSELLISPTEVAMPVIEWLREHKFEIIALLQNRTTSTTDDTLDGQWMLEHCVFRDRWWSGVGALYLDLAQWSAERDLPMPESRHAFVDSLLAEGFQVTDNAVVHGLALKVDVFAHERFQQATTDNHHTRRRKP